MKVEVVKKLSRLQYFLEKKKKTQFGGVPHQDEFLVFPVFIIQIKNYKYRGKQHFFHFFICRGRYFGVHFESHAQLPCATPCTMKVIAPFRCLSPSTAAQAMSGLSPSYNPNPSTTLSLHPMPSLRPMPNRN